MKTAFAKKEIESALAPRFGAIFERHEKPPAEILPTGVDELDQILHGFPRGAITEIHGTASSGRTSLVLSTLSRATNQEETCALIDCSDNFDPLSAANARVDFNRLLWVRCNHHLERAFKAVDLLLHSGGFGLVCLNLSDVPARSARRIISSWWFRFRRALENTPTVLVVITSVGCVRSCAALSLELKKESSIWPSTFSVLENSFLVNKVGEYLRPNLSLVTPSTSLSIDATLTHAHLVQGMRIQINRERPLQWPGPPASFMISQL
jgi:hypothetical protein